MSRRCDWCGRPLKGRRRDALTCSKKCRQARHRFRVVPAGATAPEPIRVAYADPPYPGLAARYYGAPEVDHRALVDRLVGEYPDGWALSTSATALPSVLALCPDDVRVGPWVRGPRAPRKGTELRPADVWEPVIFRGGRIPLEGFGDLANALVRGGRQWSHPGALVGMKSAAFCEWMFRMLGLRAGDQLDDLFPGSGAVARAWAIYTNANRRASTPDTLSPEPSRLEPRNLSRRPSTGDASRKTEGS